MMPRPFTFGTNFKMNQTPQESAEFYSQLSNSIEIRQNTRLFVIPPFTSLSAVAAVAPSAERKIWLGAQNVHWAPDGAFTGEISIRMLEAIGVDLVLLGHAERRGLFHETDADINKKVQTVLTSGLRGLLAVGETADERRFGVSGETVARQLKIGLHGVSPENADRLLVAYEPVWSIGAGGTPAKPEDVQPVAALIRATLAELFGDPGHDISILYGGSVDPSNAGTFTSVPDIDGLFVGRAAWTVDGYIATFESGFAGWEARETG